MKASKTKNKIPAYVSSWTDKYFHYSFYGDFLKFPSKKLIKFLSKYRKTEDVVLYRGINKYNQKNFNVVESWTYDKKIAEQYIKEISGKIEKKKFKVNQILLNTTLLNSEEKILLGYDYKIDNKEILVLV
ncbi:MAG: hypothetical protein U9Q85_04255 [Patescibacteria group bacterium]|nr:hypothetical protein [Patescibacteria group bacterium]